MSTDSDSLQVLKWCINMTQKIESFFPNPETTSVNKMKQIYKEEIQLKEFNINREFQHILCHVLLQLRLNENEMVQEKFDMLLKQMYQTKLILSSLINE
jgi:hypothetical protein